MNDLIAAPPHPRRHPLKTALCTLAAMHLLAGPVLAQTFDVDIVGYGKVENFFDALSGDIMVARSGSTLDRFEGLDGTPLDGMTMECFGSTVILNGLADGAGNCIFTDPDGDKVLQAWTVDEVGEGVAFGTWHFIGGTGRHEGVRGRGHYSNTTVALTGAKEMAITGVATWPER
jgi:hypothetical protein